MIQQHFVFYLHSQRKPLFTIGTIEKIWFPTSSRRDSACELIEDLIILTSKTIEIYRNDL